MTTTKTSRSDIYTEITARVIETMESDGLAPWTRPWTVRGGQAPRNAISGKAYRGVNPLLLMMTAWARGYTSPQWVTFRQAHHLAAAAHRAAGRIVSEPRPGVFVFADGQNAGRTVGGVAKGQSKAEGRGATAIVFWKAVKATDESGEDAGSRLIARAYHVFNLEQCDEHVQAFARAKEPAPMAFDPIAAAEQICEGFAVTTIHGGDRACYTPATDVITLPPRDSFVSPEEYYSTRFHEMGHATGHASRLARKGVTDPTRFGSHAYSEEELVAEFTTCFLAAESGIDRVTERRSAAYLRMWASKLRENPRILVHAAALGQRAADHVLGRSVAASEEAEAAA